MPKAVFLNALLVGFYEEMRVNTCLIYSVAPKSEVFVLF